MLTKIKCKLGFHQYNDLFVGLLYRQCKHCNKKIKVCDQYDYKPSGIHEVSTQHR